MLDKLKQYRDQEPVRFDAYVRRGVIAIAATVGITLDVETAGFVTGLIIYIAWGAFSTESVRGRVTPVDKPSTEDSSGAKEG